jgi:hypothetical protein
MEVSIEPQAMASSSPEEEQLVLSEPKFVLQAILEGKCITLLGVEPQQSSP